MIKKLLAAVFAALMLIAIGCSGGETILLPHFDGMNSDGSYDSSVFYRNDLTVFGGDSDVIWVPKERDPVYGGWFYQYTSGNGGVYTQWFESERSYAYSCLRSRDLNDWELCGAVDGGFAVELSRKVSGGNPVLAESDWAERNCWAPEVIYDEKTGWYVLYSSMLSYRNDGKSDSVTYSDSANGGDRNYGSICVSSTPVGPFTMVSSREFYLDAPHAVELENIQYLADDKVGNLNGEEITRVNPAIDITNYFRSVTDGKNASIDFDFGIIDLSPFVDDDGTMYLYFSKHWLSERHYLDEDETDFVPKEENRVGGYMSIWGMRMKDTITPDYDTLRLISFPNYLSVEYDNEKNGPVWLESSYKMSGYHDRTAAQNLENPDYEDHLNEGPQMSVHVGADEVKRYYLTYSQNSFYARDYGVHQAIATSPLGDFRKEGRIKSALGVETQNDYMTGVGHHALVEVGGETFCVYWVHSDPFDTNTSQYNGRAYAFDRLFWQYDAEAGFDLMYGNGPTASLQFLPDLVTSYTNIAVDAQVSANNAADKSTVKHLNDGKFVSLEYYDSLEYRAKGKTEITLKFSAPRTVRAIAVYNSYHYEYAFASVDSVEFALAEPFEHGGKLYSNALIEELGFNPLYYNIEDGFMRQGGASVASFDEIKVTSIKITVSKRLNGKKGEIRISDIAVLGV